MNLLLIRHAEALPVGSPGITSDEQRVLSPAGKSKTHQAAIALNKLGVRIQIMLASPYLRAMQTAEIFCENLDHSPQLRACDALGADFDVKVVVDAIRQVADLGSLALCGHEPDLSRLATYLMGGRGQPSLIFHTGAMAHMQLDLGTKPPTASLHWFLNSQQLERIAQSP
ncbi:MAG: phosphohistidine phosphatase SixA [Planctomycetes bacterium]|nr:phosphohistidine phosphatase SixA [Planctomycetota bacterium]